MREDREIDDQDDPVEGVELVKWTDISPGFVDEIVEIAFEKRLAVAVRLGWATALVLGTAKSFALD